MGRRGPGAKPLRVIPNEDHTELFGMHRNASSRDPWDAPGLTRAERVVAFIETLTITAGRLAGQPFRLRDWQRDIIDAIYSTDDDQGRPVRTAVLSMGRKNGKTGLAAALALCHLAGPEAEQRGEVYSAANDRMQAAKLFAEMVAMVNCHPVLKGRISERTFTKELTDFKTGSVYQALSADAATKHGLSPSCVIYDELGQAASRDLFDALDTAMGARVDPLMLVISTQAATDTAPMSDLIDYGLKVEAGAVHDPSFRLFLFSAPADSDPWDEHTWALANPALGDFLSLEEVRRQASQARRMPSKEPAFRNLILNQRVSAEKQFLTSSEWMANAEPPPPIDQLAGRPCFLGLDLSASRDLTALVLVAQLEDERYAIHPFFWLPGDGLLDREDEDKVPYTAWKLSGHLLTTPGPTINPAFIAAKVAELAGKLDVRLLSYDRWRIEEFRRQLAETGCDVPMLPFGQGYKDMAPAVDTLDRLIAERRIMHGGNPILTWNASNTVATADPSGNRKLDKSRSRGRIDGLVALVMALASAARDEGEADWSPLVEFA